MKKIWKKLLAVTLAASMTMSMVSMTSLAVEGENKETSTPTTYCRKKEHTHTDACYKTEQTLTCEWEESEAHMHTDDCYELTCTIPEEHEHTFNCYEHTQTCGLEAHTHTTGCYDENGNLTCTQPEHTHNAGCLTQGNLICTIEENHTHSESGGACYTLTCKKNPDGHTHTDACYTSETTLACEIEEHTHTPECYFKAEWDAETGTFTIYGTGELTDALVKSLMKQNSVSGLAVIKTLVIGEGITAIGNKAFYYYATNMTCANFPSTLTSIGERAFYKAGLKSVVFPANLTNIGKEAFKATKLEGVDISVTGALSIGTSAFDGVPAATISVASATPNSVSIGGSAFKGTANVNTITIKNISDIGDNAFTGTGAKELVINGAQTIGKYVLGSYDAVAAKSLTKVTLKNVGELKINAFAKGGCAITDLTLENIGKIGEAAFLGCTLQNFAVSGTVGSVDKNAFTTALTENTNVSLNLIGNTQLSYNGNYAGIADRMQAIFPSDSFVMDPVPGIVELTPEDGWDDSKTAKSSENWETDYDYATQLMEQAKWTNAGKTEAQVKVDAYYTAQKQMDFIFVADLSPSMEELGNPADMNARFYDMQSKLLNVTGKLLNAGEGYDCKVAIVGFSAPKDGVTIDEALKSLPFTNNAETAAQFVKELAPFRGNTDYGLGMKTALELVQSNTGRNMTVIFLSDGAPNSSKGSGDQYGTKNATQIKAAGVPIYGVLHSPASYATALTAMEKVCGEGNVFKANDTDSFGKAMNDAFTAVYAQQTVTIPVNEAFENVIGLTTSNPDDTVSIENGTITWTITGMPFTKHTLTYNMSLTKENADKTGEQTYPVNSGNAAIADGASVESPELTREFYNVTYTDGVEDTELFADQITNVLAGTATPAFDGTPTRSGYTFTGWSPEVAETVTGDVTYVAQWRSNYVAPTYYTVTYTDGVEGEEIFADQVTNRLTWGAATPAFAGTPARENYTFTGWSPAVAETVTDNVTYVAQWRSNYVAPTYYTLTINYVDGEGNTVADRYTTRQVSGYRYSVTSPAVAGMTPDQATVSGILTGNTTLTVTYSEDLDEPDTPTTESPEPTESPEVTETPAPTESPEESEDLGDNDTPLTELPEETETPEPTESQEPDEGEDLGDNDTPLAEVPQTGDMLWLWMTLAAGSAVSLAWISAEEKKGKRVSK